VLAGSDIVFGPAVLSSATTYSLEQFVIDNEVAGAMLRIKKGMEATKDDLAVDLIEAVGPGGQFIGTRHTMEHLKTDVWRPELADRNIHENWVKQGSKDMRAKARERALEILEKHEVRPLDPEQEKEIDGVLKESARFQS